MMRVDNISNTYKPSFNANLSTKTGAMAKYINYLSANENSADKVVNTSKRLGLFNKIVSAIKNHPSDATISIEQRQGNQGLNTIISSENASFSRNYSSDKDTIKEVESSLKEILHPRSGSMVRDLTGNPDPHTYQKWWNKNVFRIWNDVDETFT